MGTKHHLYKIVLILLLLIPLGCNAENTYSIDLEYDSSQYLVITDVNQTGLDITGDLTIEAWIKFEEWHEATYQGIMTKRGASGHRQYALMHYKDGATNDLYFFVADAVGETIGNKAVGLSTGTWYHVAVAYDASAGSAEFFVDGSSVGSAGSLKNSILNSDADFNIGANSSSGLYFDGLIDDARIWDDIRSEAEISANMEAELTGTEDNLVGYWKLNNDATDEDSNGNDLTEANSPVYSEDVPFEDGGGAGGSTVWTYNTVAPTMIIAITILLLFSFLRKVFIRV